VECVRLLLDRGAGADVAGVSCGCWPCAGVVWRGLLQDDAGVNVNELRLGFSCAVIGGGAMLSAIIRVTASPAQRHP
jgi:hypothetical protein